MPTYGIKPGTKQYLKKDSGKPGIRQNDIFLNCLYVIVYSNSIFTLGPPPHVLHKIPAVEVLGIPTTFCALRIKAKTLYFLYLSTLYIMFSMKF